MLKQQTSSIVVVVDAAAAASVVVVGRRRIAETERCRLRPRCTEKSSKPLRCLLQHHRSCSLLLLLRGKNGSRRNTGKWPSCRGRCSLLRRVSGRALFYAAIERARYVRISEVGVVEGISKNQLCRGY